MPSPPDHRGSGRAARIVGARSDGGLWTEAPRGGPGAAAEGGGGGVRGGRDRGVAGAGRPAAERTRDAGPARGRGDRVAPAGGRALARPAGRLAALADRVRLVPALARPWPARRPAARGGAP